MLPCILCLLYTDSDTATIIGIACGIVGGIVLFFVMAVVIYYCAKKRRHRTQRADFTGRSSSDTGKGYEPLQFELTKKPKSTGKKTKRCKYMVYHLASNLHQLSFVAEEYVEL